MPGSKNYELTVTGDISTFDDYGETSAYAVTPFNWAIGKGLIAGVGDHLLDPTGNAERSHIAAIMKSFCEVFLTSEEDGYLREIYFNFAKSINEIEKVVESYEDKNGFVDPARKSEVIDAVAQYVESSMLGEEAISFNKDDGVSIYVEFPGNIGYIFSPQVAGELSGGGNTITTFLPQGSLINNIGFSIREFEALLDAKLNGYPYYDAQESANQIENKIEGIQTTLSGTKVNVKALKSINPPKVLIWEGHGAYNSQIHSCLVTDEKINQINFNEYYDDIRTGKLIVADSGYICLTEKFVKAYMTQLNDTLVFLGACHSLQDNVLADAFIDNGAAVVIGYVNVTYISYEMLTRSFFFDTLTRNNCTVNQALTYTKNLVGEDCKNNIPGEIISYPTNSSYVLLSNYQGQASYLKCRIVGKDSQQGISGAKVSIYLGSDLLQTITTDENGDFSSDGFAFEMNETNLAKLKLVIEKEGYLTLTTPVSMATGNPDNDLKWDLGVFELTPIKITPASITGVVRRDLDLNSLSGVSVYLNCLFGAGGEDIGATSITDKEGKFTIEVPDNATALTSLRFEKEGYESYTYLLPSNADASVNVGVIRLKLKPIEIFTASISGIVSDASSNQAVENATVEFYNGESKVSTETTNSGGSFYAAILTPGTYSIRVTKSGYQSYETTLTVENGKNSQIEISLVPVSSEKVVYVSNAEQFNAIRNDLDAHYILTSDINLSGYSTWKPIGTTKKPFTGILDGDDHTITGMKITSFDLSEEIESKGSTGYCGAALFGTVNSGGVIQNIAIQNASIYCDSGYVSTCYALLVGKLFGESKVDNCIVSGSINLSSPGCYVGGVVSYATDSEIINSRSNTNIGLYAQLNNNANSFAGGVVGYSYSGSGSVRHCRNEGNISMNIEALGWAASIGVSESTGVGGVVGFGLAEDSCNTASRLTLSGNVPTGECGRISGIRLNGRNVNCVSYSKTLVNGSQVSSSDASSIHGRDISSLQSLDEWYNQ